MNYGYEDRVERDDTVKEHLDTLLDALSHVRSTTQDDTITGDFVSFDDDNKKSTNKNLGYLARYHDKNLMYTLFKKRRMGISSYTIQCKKKKGLYESNTYIRIYRVQFI